MESEKNSKGKNPKNPVNPVDPVLRSERQFKVQDSRFKKVLTAALCGAAMIGRLCNPALKLLTFFHGAEP